MQNNKVITFIEAKNHASYRMVTEPIQKELERRGFLTEVIYPQFNEEPSKNSQMIVTNYFWALGKLKQYYNTENNIVVYTAHGIAPWKFFNSGYPSCDYVFLSSEFERDKLFSIGGKNPNNDHTITTGWSKLDILNSKIKNKKSIKEKIIKKLSLKKNKPIIAYLPTHTIRSKPSIAGSILSLENFNPKEIDNFVIGIHYFDETKKDVKETISKFDYVWNKQDKYDLMVSADIIVGDLSSVMVEALLLDKPIIHLMNKSNSLYMYETKKYGECILGEVCHDVKKLKEVIKNNLQNDPYRAQRENWKQKLITNVGNATNTAVDNIIKILDERS